MEELIIIGAGVTGRELASVIADINDHKPTWKLIGFDFSTAILRKGQNAERGTGARPHF